MRSANAGIMTVPTREAGDENSQMGQSPPDLENENMERGNVKEMERDGNDARRWRAAMESRRFGGRQG